MKIANFWREIASFYLLSEWNKNNQYVLQFFLVLVLFTACLYHFLFWRYFNSSMVSFLSDILLSFPNLNNLNNHVWQKITQNRKSFITQSKHSWWSVLGISTKKKKFNRFYQLFFRTTGLQPKLLILIESPKKGKLGVVFEAKFGQNLVQCCEKTKKLVIQLSFSDTLHEVYIYKHILVVIEIPEWKLKAKLAWSTIFEGS